jgi:hypothetical protein
MKQLTTSTNVPSGPGNSLLDPNYRIIQKPHRLPLKIISIDTIDSKKKRANLIALNNLNEDFRKEFFDEYNLFCNLDIWVDFKDRLNKQLLDFAKTRFNGYIKEINSDDRFIYATDKISDENIIFELDTRYSKSYQEKIQRRAKYLSYHFRRSKSVLLTLTIDPSIYSDDKFKMWINIKKEYNRFITAVKYYFKKQGMKLPPYICTIEAQKGRAENNYVARGNPHLHICFLGASRLLDWRVLRDLWGLGHIWINRAQDNRKIRNPVNYIMKYITKTYTETNNENCLTQSLCWLFNIRSYQCSRGLITPLKPNGESLYASKYLIIVNDNRYSFFLYDNLDLIPDMMNTFYPYNSEFYKKMKRLIEKYN